MIPCMHSTVSVDICLFHVNIITSHLQVFTTGRKLSGFHGYERCMSWSSGLRRRVMTWKDTTVSEDLAGGGMPSMEPARLIIVFTRARQWTEPRETNLHLKVTISSMPMSSKSSLPFMSTDKYFIRIWTIGVLGFHSRRGLGIFLFTTASGTALGPTSLLSNGYQGLFPWR
jgi:hypothetical protein